MENAVTIKVDNLDDAVRGVQDAVGITDGGVAGMVLCSYDEVWPALDYWERLAALREWRDAEKSYQRLFNAEIDAPEQHH